MEVVVREVLYVYAVDVDPFNAQRFVYRGRLFGWSVRGPHVCMTRYEPDGTLRLTFWHGETRASLRPKLNGYLQAQRWATTATASIGEWVAGARPTPRGSSS